MEQKHFEKAFIDKLNTNYQSRAKYFERRFMVFCELYGTVFEINECLTLEFYRASITLTNNLLERLLKLSLIYNEVGIDSLPPEDWNSSFEGPNKAYSSCILGNSIEKCRKFDLITEDEKEFLFTNIRNLMRNGFSHADSKIFENYIPGETTMFKVVFSNPTELIPVTVNQKLIPFMQDLHIYNFAKNNATLYFEYVYELILNIEQRLKDRTK